MASTFNTNQTAQELLCEDFTLVSVEEEEVCFKLYELMAWSKGFRGLVTTGSGEKRVQLDEKAITIMLFKEIIDTQTFNPDKHAKFRPFDQVRALLLFLDKYECDLAMHFFLSELREMVTTRALWPPLLLFIAGATLDQPELCEIAFDVPAKRWASLQHWMLPRGLAGNYVLSQQNCLHPRGVPHSILSTMPFDYAQALNLVWIPDASDGAQVVDPVGARFRSRFDTVREDIKQWGRAE